jgi:uncharacterized protein YbjT (DUF2867 family)
MRVAILGGTGTAGGALARELVRRRHAVRLLSRRPPRTPVEGTEHAVVDVATGAGLPGALEGADGVVDAVNATRHAERVMLAGTRRIAAAAAEAGVGHLVGLSIVGCDRTPLAYYRVKTEQERVIEAAGVPWSVLRATQFHDLPAWVFALAARWHLLPAGRLPLQPVAVGDAAAALADLVEAGPSGRRAIAGPRIERLGELARTWRVATGTRALPLPVPLATPALRAIARGSLCDPSAPRGSVTFADWLARR